MSARQACSSASRVRASRVDRAASPSAPLYVVAGERYYLFDVARGRVVLRSLDRPAAFLDSDVSGEFDPAGWTYG